MFVQKNSIHITSRLLITLCFFASMPIVLFAAHQDAVAADTDTRTNQQIIEENQQKSEDELREGDLMGERMENASESLSLAERNNLGEGIDCEELANYYAYRENKDEVRCTRQGGPSSCDFHCYETRVAGCFAPETKILMGDGSVKRIDKIRMGDLVWSPSLGKALPVKRIVGGPEKEPMYEIGFGKETIRVTKTHPMVTGDATSVKAKVFFQPTSLGLPKTAVDPISVRFKQANQISKKDSVLTSDGTYQKVTTVRLLPVVPEQEVFNIELESSSIAPKAHVLVADGMVTGDYLVQGQLSADR